MGFYERFELLVLAENSKVNIIGKELGFSSGSLTAWKNGTKPKLDAVVDIAKRFNVSTDYLLGRSDDKFPPSYSARSVEVSDFKAAFWGGDKDLTDEQKDELWDDVRDYARYKAEQKKKGK